jgi:hypothetical protein
MTDDYDEARKRAAEAAGRWRDIPPGQRPEPAFVRRQKEMLGKLSELIAAQIERDHATVAELQEKVNRLRHGGGV